MASVLCPETLRLDLHSSVLYQFVLPFVFGSHVVIEYVQTLSSVSSRMDKNPQ